MKRLLLLLCCFSLVSCGVSTKPFFWAADHHEQPVTRTLTVLYDDYAEADVIATVSEAAQEFAQRTNIHVDVVEYRQMDWQNHDIYKMSDQALQLYPGKLIPSDWVLMIYRRTPLEIVFRYAVGWCPKGMAEAGGHWALVSELDKKLIIHEWYHLGWKAKYDKSTSNKKTGGT